MEEQLNLNTEIKKEIDELDDSMKISTHSDENKKCLKCKNDKCTCSTNTLERGCKSFEEGTTIQCDQDVPTANVDQAELARRKITGKKEKLGCCKCKKIFHTAGNYEKHFKQHHSNYSLAEMYDNPVRCDLCERYFKNEENLKKHKYVHRTSGTKPTFYIFQQQPRLSCRKCGKHFYDAMKYELHWKEQHPNASLDKMYYDPVQCEMCSRYFPNDRSLTDHKTFAHPPLLSPELAYQDDEEVSLICPSCKQTFSESSEYEMHWKRFHAVDVKQPEMFLNAVNCKICNNYFQSAESLQIHVDRVHHYEHIEHQSCKLCKNFLCTCSAIRRAKQMSLYLENDQIKLTAFLKNPVAKNITAQQIQPIIKQQTSTGLFFNNSPVKIEQE